jgi:hypothetical protein
MKQTSVEWLFKELDNYYQMKSKFRSKKEILEQAKEIYKQEIENSFEAGFVTQQWDKTKENKAEQYFKQKFEEQQSKMPNEQLILLAKQ